MEKERVINKMAQTWLILAVCVSTVFWCQCMAQITSTDAPTTTASLTSTMAAGSIAVVKQATTLKKATLPPTTTPTTTTTTPKLYTCAEAGNNTVACPIGCFAVYEAKNSTETLTYGCLDIVTDKTAKEFAKTCSEESKNGDCWDTNPEELCVRCCNDKDSCNKAYTTKKSFQEPTKKDSSKSSASTLLASILMLTATTMLISL